MKQEGYEYYRGYNSYNGQRELAFYIPGVDYGGRILNDLPELDKMNEDKRVELAISFDKDYSFEEVKGLLPAGAKPVWYWVDTYDEREGFNFKPYPNENDPAKMNYPTPMNANYGVYGFGVQPDWDQAKPEHFIGTVQVGVDKKDNYHSEYQRIFNYLKKRQACTGGRGCTHTGCGCNRHGGRVKEPQGPDIRARSGAGCGGGQILKYEIQRAAR
ncbi:anti sigma factor C-terminal domain-containing protein [Paenibacillus rhizoplanae]